MSIGFGARVRAESAKSAEPFYGEWEIGTYSAAWRIVRGGGVVCGSAEVVNSIEELDTRLQEIKLGAVVAIAARSRLDIRVELDNDVIIDFLYAASDNDEVFHIFGPAKLYIEYTPEGHWKVGTANSPWT